MSKEKEYLEALQRELAGYENKGMTDRADAVKKEIAKLAPKKATPKKADK